LRFNSRLIVEAARFKCRAISRNEHPAATPCVIRSRSAALNARLERRRESGLMPPHPLIRRRTLM
jgi:hypothetical protein